MIKELRQFSRTPINLVVQLTFPDGKVIEAGTWDISDGGISVNLDQGIPFEWPVNTELKAQVTGLPVEGPIIPLKIIRINQGRLALQIIKPT